MSCLISASRPECECGDVCQVQEMIIEAVADERKACIEIVLIGYRNDWTHAMIVDENHARSTPTTWGPTDDERHSP